MHLQLQKTIEKFFEIETSSGNTQHLFLYFIIRKKEVTKNKISFYEQLNRNEAEIVGST